MLQSLKLGIKQVFQGFKSNRHYFMATNVKNVATEKSSQNMFVTQREIIWDHFEVKFNILGDMM